jgi:hypothetical protein
MESELHQRGIVVAEDRLTIRHRDREGIYQCRVSFDLARDHRFLIDCLESVHELGIGIGPMPRDALFVKVLPGAEPIECGIFEMEQKLIGEGASVHVKLLPQGTNRVADYGLPVVRINAGIANLHRYWFGGPKRLSFSLEGGGWLFNFMPVGDETLLYPSQAQDESYAFTHHLDLRKADSDAFSCSEAEQALDTLSTFLSFCAERWVCPALVVGFDNEGTAAMEDWGSRMLDARREPNNWLDRDHGGAMVEVFPGFWHLMEDPMWKKTVRTAVYWYVRADTNHVGPDGAIVLMQAALERLAWHVLVQRHRAVSEEGFSRKLPTADRIRLLLHTCSIPLDFPAELADLGLSAPAQRWKDGPEAFVSVRNRIVHPREQQKPISERGYYEALQLGKWYLELVLLRSCGFAGQYSRRLKIPRYVGEVEAVPWANPVSATP